MIDVDQVVQYLSGGEGCSLDIEGDGDEHIEFEAVNIHPTTDGAAAFELHALDGTKFRVTVEELTE